MFLSNFFAKRFGSYVKKAIPLHPLSRTNAISQMNKMKLASVLSWLAVELNERHLKLTPIENVREGSDKERVL